MRAVRVLLVVLGLAVVAYGGRLLWPHLPTAWTWLVAGPLVHDLLVAPLVLAIGLTARRAVRHPGRRTWLVRALTVTAVLLLVAVPLAWRPHAAPPNPGLQDRDYATGLAVWLALLWAGALAGVLASGRRRPPPRP